MAGATIATVSAILKDLYLPPVVEQLNNEILLMQRLESRDQEVTGNQAVVPLHTTRSSGIGARGEDVALPAAGNQGFQRLTYDLKYLYGRGRVTGPSMSKTRNSTGAFLSVLEAEMDGLRTDIKLDTSRQTYGDGSAQIAVCGTTTAANLVVLGAGGAEATRKGFLHVGMGVDIGTVADYDVIATNRTITAVDPVGATVTIDGAAVTTDGTHFITRSGNAVSNAIIYEIDGLRKLVSTAANTVGGLSAVTYGYWDNMRTSLGGALTLDAFTQAYNQVEIAGGDCSLMIGSFGGQRALFNLLQGQVRYVEPMVIQGGFTALEYMGKPFIADRHHPFGQVDFLDEKFLKFFHDGEDWHFLDKDGDILKWVIGYDSWEFALAKYCQMGATRRNTQFLLYGITGDTNGY